MKHSKGHFRIKETIDKIDGINQKEHLSIFHLLINEVLDYELYQKIKRFEHEL